MIQKDITQNVIVDFKKKGDADTKRAVKELDSAVDGLKARVKETTGAVKQFEDAFTKAVAPGPGLWGKFSAGIKSAAEMMSPLNQGLELAGKAVRFASEGLDAYAKTSKSAAKEVEALTAEFKNYRDTVMASVGELTVALLKPAMSFDTALKKLEGIENNRAFQIMYGSDGKRRDLRGMIEAAGLDVDRLEQAGLIKVTRTTNPYDMLASAAAVGFGEVRKQLNETADHWDTRGKTLVDSMRKGFDEIGKTTTKAAAGISSISSVRGAIESGRISTAAGTVGTDTAGPMLGFSRQPLGSLADSTMRDEFGRDSERGVLDELNEKHGAAFEEMTSREDRFRDSFSRRNESYLESLFGPIDEFDAYATAFDTLQTATQSAMSAWISGSMSLGTAIKKGIGDALGALASQLAVEALKHGAYAVGSLAFGDFAGASRHGLAAGAFGLGAVAAASAAKSLGGSVAAEVAAQKGAASGGGSAAGRDHRTADGGGAAGGGIREVIREKTTVVYTDAFASGTPGVRRRMARKALDAAKGGDHWEDN